jgi:hypothetical protein
VCLGLSPQHGPSPTEWNEILAKDTRGDWPSPLGEWKPVTSRVWRGGQDWSVPTRRARRRRPPAFPDLDLLGDTVLVVLAPAAE